MNDLYRLIDANINRASEGTRVLEDLARLHFGDAELCRELRSLRHGVRELGKGLSGLCLAARAAESDVGLAVSLESGLDARPSVAALVAANFKRLQEALRVVEEVSELAGHRALSQDCEVLRFRAYALERRYVLHLRPQRAQAALATDLYGITAEEHSRGRRNPEVVAAMLAAGIRIVQYREKDKVTGACYRECQEIRRMTWDAGATFIVNDHPELALLVEADGVHLGQEDYPLEAVRALVGEKMLIGLSTHSPEQATDAIRRGADYVGVGPLYRTFTKKNVCDPVGLEYLDYAVANLELPFVVLGGVKVHNVAEVCRRGARCVALVTEIVGAPDIETKVKEIRAAMEQGKGRQA